MGYVYMYVCIYVCIVPPQRVRFKFKDELGVRADSIKYTIALVTRILM